MKKPLAMAALAVATTFGGTAQAVITVYTTQVSYNAAITSPGTDTFQSLPTNALTASPITRTAGTYGYTATAAGGFYGAGPAADHWLSTNLSGTAITLNAFTGGVSGAGAFFFSSDISGAFAASASITVSATDASGTVTQVILNPTTTSFRGFVSTTGLTALTITPVDIATFATANDLILGRAPAATAVPEPASWMTMTLGIGLAGAALRRRRGATVAA